VGIRGIRSTQEVSALHACTSGRKLSASRVLTGRLILTGIESRLIPPFCNAFGPGVYDIHAPRVPKVEEIENLLRRAAEVLDLEQIFGSILIADSRRGWKEVLPSLTAMVLAATMMRKPIAANPRRQVLPQHSQDPAI
jgi:Cobalamin-independent synthase, Catalytic domain